MTPDELRESKAQIEQFLTGITAGVERAVVELRALAVPRKFGGTFTRAGFFDLPAARKEFITAVGSLLKNDAGQPEGVYVTLNPLKLDMLARAHNRLVDVFGRKAVSAADVDVTARRHLLIDVDPVRLAGVCATDEEKAAARLVFEGVRADMRRLQFADPLFVIDSGSGMHGWYGVDLPRDDDGRVERFIKWLAKRHSTAAATIDTSVFNPARITKVPGTFNRKGDHVPEIGRLHRPVVILETHPGAASPVPAV